MCVEPSLVALTLRLTDTELNRQVSSRWSFPNYYYDFFEPCATFNGSTCMLHVIMIDTVLLSGDSRDPLTGEDVPGSKYPGPIDKSKAEDQWQWIESTINGSAADYVIVAGHFPIWSICEHGPLAYCLLS